MPSKELFLGNLGRDVSRKEIEDVFEKYGRVVRCDIKDKGDYFNYLKRIIFPMLIIFNF